MNFFIFVAIKKKSIETLALSPKQTFLNYTTTSIGFERH